MSAGTGAPPPLDPSMEDILASIRRILSEEEQRAGPGPGAASEDNDPFPLTPEMIVSQAAPPSAEASARDEGGLVAPAVAAAAAAALGSLPRAAAPERGPRLSAGGPTLEQVVREELRPLLKEWLDANLPALVERVVRSEIERVVSRAAG